MMVAAETRLRLGLRSTGTLALAGAICRWLSRSRWDRGSPSTVVAECNGDGGAFDSGRFQQAALAVIIEGGAMRAAIMRG